MLAFTSDKAMRLESLANLKVIPLQDRLEVTMHNTLTIELPVAGLPTAAELPANFAEEARFLLATKLFEQGRISSGKAGRLCGMGRVEFLLAASRSGVPVVDLRDDELADEFS